METSKTNQFYQRERNKLIPAAVKIADAQARGEYDWDKIFFWEMTRLWAEWTDQRKGERRGVILSGSKKAEG